jgi:hypothetical protein
MIKYFLLLFSFSTIYNPLFSQNDFFPLNVGNYYKYEYQSIKREYESILQILETRDTGIVKFEIISVADKDFLFEWTIREIDSLTRTVDTIYNGIGIDTVFDISSVSIYLLIESKDSLHKIIFNPRTEIWESPRRWHSPIGNIYGGSFYRYSYEDTIKSSVQNISQYPYVMWDSLTFIKNIGLTSAKSSIFKGPNTLYHYEWNASLIDYKIVTDIEVVDKVFSFKLLQNFPNPFNPNTVINYSVPQLSFVILKVYDVLGKEIAALVYEEKSAGDYMVEFNGSNLSSGIYFYRMQAGNFSDTKKFILLR